MGYIKIEEIEKLLMGGEITQAVAVRSLIGEVLSLKERFSALEEELGRPIEVNQLKARCSCEPGKIEAGDILTECAKCGGVRKISP